MDEALQQSLECKAVERCRSGDTGEFHVIVSLHSEALFRASYGVTDDDLLAEDVVQDDFARAWKKFNQLQNALSDCVQCLVRLRMTFADGCSYFRLGFTPLSTFPSNQVVDYLGFG
ncbi:MAG: hypothetical protein OSB68_04185 [Dehalococcoidia bacterium]|nr:hypothetical protein [Dehalococcoidia bacterium]